MIVNNINTNPCAEISLTPMENPHNFKVGDIVVGNNENNVLAGKTCIIESIRDFNVYFTIVGIGKGYNVGSLKVFRPLNKLEKALK